MPRAIICSLVQLANYKIPFHCCQPVPKALRLLLGEQLYDFRSLKGLDDKSDILDLAKKVALLKARMRHRIESEPETFTM
jgi:hypothetical protein